MVRLVVCLGLVAALATACLGGSRHPFVPKTVAGDRRAEQTLAKLQERTNAHDARGVCELYSSPSARCIAIWRKRVNDFPTPVAFSMRRLIFGCAGDARLVFSESSRRGQRLRTLSLVSRKPSIYNLVIDIPMGHRRSSLIVPASGTCATDGDNLGGIGADDLDPASTDVQPNRH